MAYEDFIRLGGKTDVPLKGTVTRRFALENGACPDCAARLSGPTLHCDACGLDHIVPKFHQKETTP